MKDHTKLKSRSHDFHACPKCGVIFTSKAVKDEHVIMCDGKRVR